MNTKAKKWVEALRSGKYRQAQEYLQKNGRFCCLGVACDLYAQENKNAKWDGDNFILDNEFNSDILPQAVMEWLGLRGTSGQYNSGSLTQLNDAGVTFEEIANVIESEPEGLF